MFDGVGRTAEAFVIDAPHETDAPIEPAPGNHTNRTTRTTRTTWGPIKGLPEYGWRIEVELIAWVRDQSRFGSIDALTDQIERDCTKITRLLTALDEQGVAANGISTRPSVQGAPV